MADEEQCNGSTHQNGALPASIAELGSKAGIAAVISEEAESRWSEVKKEVRTSNEVKMSSDVFRKAKMQESRVAGEVLFDGGQGERRMERGDGEPAREEDEQRMSSKNGSSTTERAKSKQYTAARQDRNRRRRKEKQKNKAEKKRHKQPSDFVACVPESDKNDMCDYVLSYESDEIGIVKQYCLS